MLIRARSKSIVIVIVINYIPRYSSRVTHSSHFCLGMASRKFRFSNANVAFRTVVYPIDDPPTIVLQIHADDLPNINAPTQWSGYLFAIHLSTKGTIGQSKSEWSKICWRFGGRFQRNQSLSLANHANTLELRFLRSEQFDNRCFCVANNVPCC